MNFRTRLSLTCLETRETPTSIPIVVPYSGSAPAAPGPATAATAGASAGGATAPGGGQTTSTGTVSPTTNTTTPPATTPPANTGILGNNSVTGQPLLESSLTN